MRKVELLPTRDFEAGYGPDFLSPKPPLTKLTLLLHEQCIYSLVKLKLVNQNVT